MAFEVEGTQKSRVTLGASLGIGVRLNVDVNIGSELTTYTMGLGFGLWPRASFRIMDEAEPAAPPPPFPADRNATTHRGQRTGALGGVTWPVARSTVNVRPSTRQFAVAPPVKVTTAVYSPSITVSVPPAG